MWEETTKRHLQDSLYSCVDRSLTTTTRPKTNKEIMDDSDGDSKPSPTSSSPKWYTENPSPISSWQLPKNANFAEVFDFNDEKRRPFSSHWPKLPHHKTKETCYSCPRYQTTGRCRARCKLAHCPSGKLPREAHDEMESKIKAALEYFKNS